MAEDRLHQPHDKLAKSSFEDLPTATAFFQQYLPPSLVRLISWSSLKVVPSSYIDDRLHGSESDLLYQVALSKPGSSAPPTPAFVYLLFEHQRRKDPWIALRLLTYQVRIWEQFRSSDPLSPTLPPIIPIVLAQNNQTWSLSPRFHSLFDLSTHAIESDLARFIPDFTFRLIELAELPFDKISGTVLGTLTLRLLKAEQIGDLLSDFVWDEDLLLHLSSHHRLRLLRYILGVGDIDKTSIQRKLSQLKTAAIQDATMTLADQFRQEGREQAVKKTLTLADQFRQEGRDEAVKKTMTLAEQFRQEGREEAVKKAKTLAEQFRQEGHDEAVKKTLTLAEQFRQEGRLLGEEKGRLEGQAKGQLIGKIQLLQDLLGREITPAEALASRSLNELQALLDTLKAALP